MENVNDDLLLNDKSILLFRPKLACLIGVNEAIVFQQIAYWVERSEKVIDGKKWTYNTYLQWQEQFPFWHEDTIRSLVKSLEKRGLIESGYFNKSSFDRTKWYTICHDKLKELQRAVVSETPIRVKDPDRYPKNKISPIRVKDPNGIVPETRMGSCPKPESSIPKTISKGSTEISPCDISSDVKKTVKGTKTGQLVEDFDDFWKAYPNHSGDKGNARKAWDKHAKKVSLSLILQAIEAQKQERANCEALGVWKEYWAHASTWLNRHRWELEIEPYEAIKARAPKSFKEIERDKRSSSLVSNMEFMARKFESAFQPTGEEK